MGGGGGGGVWQHVLGLGKTSNFSWNEPTLLSELISTSGSVMFV